MDILIDYDDIKLKSTVKELGQPEFRVKQLKKWLFGGFGFEEMSDLPIQFREILKEKYIAQPIKIHETLKSKDGSIKYLYELIDGNIIEGVFMPNKYGNTICVSTQVGCRMGCSFCASGIGGLIRNLTPAEILSQVLVVNRANGGTLASRAISNIVLMGSGEPLDNYANVLRFFEMVNSPEGLNISYRNISLSTCGLVENIRDLADRNLGVTLSISLHSTTDEARQELMPIAKKYSVHEIMGAAKYYFEKTGRRVIFEYSMVKGKNINFFDAKRLAEMTKGFSSHVNLIMLNPVAEKNIIGCSKVEGERFCERLSELGVSATIRRSLGSDVGGACGQLRRKYIDKKE